MKNKLLLKEEADDEIKFVDDDVFYSDEPVEVDLPPVETPIEPVIEPEVVHNAYTDVLQDLLRKQWDVINACDMLVATLAMEENATFDKEAVTSILQSLSDDITATVGMTTKAMSIVDPTQDELMKEGERKAEDAINMSDKEPVDESLKDVEAKQPVDEDIETVWGVNSSNYTGFNDLNEYERYWAWYAIGQIEYMLDGLSDSEIAEDEVLTTLNDLDEDSLRDLAIDVGNRISDNDYIWETISDVSFDIIRDTVHEGEYAERAIPTSTTTRLGGNNPNEGEQ